MSGDTAEPVHPPSPYGPSGIESILSRLNKIATVTWHSTDAQGTVLHTIVLPDDLFAIGSVWDRIGRFSYFRGDVELEFRVNTTGFQYGQLLLYHLPVINSTGLAAAVNSIHSASTIDPIVLSANNDTPVKYTIPYQYFRDWIELSLATSQSGNIASMGMAVLWPLQSANTSGVTQIDISVWARFVNVKLAAPYSKKYTIPGPRAPPKVRQQLRCNTTHVVPQSGEAFARTKAGAETAGSRLKTFKASIFNPIGDIISAVSPILGAIGLDKPSSLALPTPVRTLDFRTDIHKDTSDNAPAYATDPRAHVADDQKFFGRAQDADHSWIKRAQVPSLLDLVSIAVTATPGTLITKYPVGPFAHTTGGSPDTADDNWFAWSARHFQQWQGSVDYMFHFSTSSYTTARVRICWMADNGGNPESDNGGEVYSRIIEIKGDTVSKIRVPWLCPQGALRPPDLWNSRINSNGYIYLSLVNTPVTVDTTVAATIECSVWVAAGPDIQLFGLGADTTAAPSPTLKSNKASSSVSLAHPQGDIRDAFNGSFEPLVPADLVAFKDYVTCDPVPSMRTDVRRYRYLTTIGNATYSYYMFGSWSAPGLSYDLYSRFRFWRGSFRYKLWNQHNDTADVQLNAGTGKQDGFPTQAFGGVFVTQTCNSENPMYFEIPYRSNVRYLGTYDTRSEWPIAIITPSGATEQIQVWYASGDDVSFASALPLLSVSITP